MRAIDSGWLVGELKVEKADIKTALKHSVFKKNKDDVGKKDEQYYYMNTRDGKTLPRISESFREQKSNYNNAGLKSNKPSQ